MYSKSEKNSVSICVIWAIFNRDIVKCKVFFEMTVWGPCVWSNAFKDMPKTRRRRLEVDSNDSLIVLMATCVLDGLLPQIDYLLTTAGDMSASFGTLKTECNCNKKIYTS